MPLPASRPAAAVVGLVVLATAGCGPAASPAAEPEPPFPGVEEAVHQSQGKVPPPTVERLPFRSGEPSALFGRRQVAQGYAEAVWFASATTFAAQTLLPGTWQNPGAFTRHTSRMTADMARETRTTVEACWDGDPDACELVYSWRFYLGEDDRYELQPQGPFVVDHVIHESAVWVDRTGTEPHLAVRFEQRGDLRVRMDGEDVLVPLVKDATYGLVPAPEATTYGWQIDWIDVSWVELEPVADDGSY